MILDLTSCDQFDITGSFDTFTDFELEVFCHTLEKAFRMICDDPRHQIIYSDEHDGSTIEPSGPSESTYSSDPRNEFDKADEAYERERDDRNTD